MFIESNMSPNQHSKDSHLHPVQEETKAFLVITHCVPSLILARYFIMGDLHFVCVCGRDLVELLRLAPHPQMTLLQLPE